jgi:hypothetical protein
MTINDALALLDAGSIICTAKHRFRKSRVGYEWTIVDEPSIWWPVTAELPFVDITDDWVLEVTE